MKRKNIFLSVLLVAALAFVGSQAFAALSAVDESFNASDVVEINNSGPATAKTKLGTRLRGVLQNETTTFTGTGAADEIDIDEADAVVRFVTVAGGGISESALGSGTSNQLLTLVLVTDGGQNVDITPTTKTGFSSITMQDANDSCTLRWQDSTVGWVVAGNNGCTIN